MVCSMSSLNRVREQPRGREKSEAPNHQSTRRLARSSPRLMGSSRLRLSIVGNDSGDVWLCYNLFDVITWSIERQRVERKRKKQGSNHRSLRFKAESKTDIRQYLYKCIWILKNLR